MQKKGIIAVLSVVVLMIVTSLTLVLTLGPWVSADSEEPSVGILDKAEYFNITHEDFVDELGYAPVVLSGLSEIGRDYAMRYDELHVVVPEGVNEISGYIGYYYGEGRYCTVIGAFDWSDRYDGSSYRNKNDFGYKVMDIILPKTLKVIGIASFYECGIQSIKIPASVTVICAPQFDYYGGKVDAFKSCDNLTEIIVENENLLTNENLAEYVSIMRYEAPQPATVTVTFNANNDTDNITSTVNINTNVEQPVNPLRNGYDFQYWYVTDENVTFDFANTPVAQDIILNAKWKKKTYTVKFNVDGTETSQMVEHGAVVDISKVPVATKVGHNFVGWYVDNTYSTQFNLETSITTNTTVYAKFDVNKYAVTFLSDGGSLVDGQTVDHSAKATKPADPTKDGYAFAGWYLNNVAYDFNTPVTANVTLNAQWTINEYTVVFNSNGGSVVVAEVVNYNEKVTKPTDPTREGYTFHGWYSDAELVNAYDFDTAVTNNVTLYAKWEAVPAEESGVNVAAVAGGVAGGVAGVGTLSSILAIVIRRRRKL